MRKIEIVRKELLANFLRSLCFAGDSVLELLFPSRCHLCNALDQEENASSLRCGFCNDCYSLVVPQNRSCPHCGGTRYEISAEASHCPSCSQWKVAFDRVLAIGQYHGPLESMLYNMKFEPSGRTASLLAKLFLELRAEELLQLDLDLIVPVPMFFTRRMIRGINAPDEIARVLGKFLHRPVMENVMFRGRSTLRQIELTREERLKNLSGAFAISKRGLLFHRSPSRRIVNKKILLVDDVLTTGATCHEAARTLLEAGAQLVTVAVLGRGQGKEIADVRAGARSPVDESSC